MSTKPKTLTETALRHYRLVHERLLKMSEDLSDDQLRWSAGPSLHSVAWQLWHCARWDDVFAAHFNADLGREPKGQVWDRDSIAERWSLTPGSMGRRDAGTGMSDADAEKVQFPSKGELIGYVRQVFAFADEVVAAMPDERMLAVATDDPDGDTNLDNALIYLEHLTRHLGMIEAIRGLQGLSGSATT
jgi:hypothetical protein